MPSAIRTANVSGKIPFFFPRILNDPMQFDAAIAFTLAVRRVHLARNIRTSNAILYHSHKATAALRQKLLSGEGITSDAVIFTVLSLAIVQVYTPLSPCQLPLIFLALFGQC